MFPVWFTESALRTLDKFAALRGYRDPRSQHAITGERGEEAAYFFLRRNGYTIVARNYRSPRCRGELDLVGYEGKTLCFIEVKTRTARDFAPAETAVDPEKREDLRRIAREYVRHLPGVTARLRSAKQNELPPTRFDVLSVYLLPNELPQFELRRNSFGWQ